MYNRVMYKDNEKARVASKERMRRMRQGVTKGVTSQEGVTRVEEQGVTEEDFVIIGGARFRYKGRVEESEGTTEGVPEFARVLPRFTIDRVIAVLKSRSCLGLPDDSVRRWARAVSYHEWELAGRPVECAL